LWLFVGILYFGCNKSSNDGLEDVLFRHEMKHAGWWTQHFFWILPLLPLDVPHSAKIESWLLHRSKNTDMGTSQFQDDLQLKLSVASTVMRFE
jgi:hypothetical protein